MKRPMPAYRWQDVETWSGLARELFLGILYSAVLVGVAVLGARLMQ